MITITEIEAFETRLTELMANFKNEVMAELKKAGIKKPDNFLQEISQPIEVVQDEPEKEGELPNMNGIEIPEQETNPEPKKNIVERDSKEFLALAEFSMLKGWEKANVDNFLISKGLTLTEKDEKHLGELRKFGKMVKSGQMDVTSLLDQNCLSEVERSFFTQKYIF